MLSTIPIAHFPPGLRFHAVLFKDVRNSGYLRDQLLSGNPRFEYAFIDAAMVLSTAHVLAAVFRAVNDSAQARLRTRNIHSEIVFAMSPNKNIAESFRKFGITEHTTSLLVIKVCPDDVEDIAQYLKSSIEGTPVGFLDENIADLSNLNEIKKIYKLNSTSTKPKTNMRASGGSPVTLPDQQDLEMTILGMLALKGAS